jgi:hypothetical protein
MGAGKFHHFGVPTDVKADTETFIEGGKVYVTDPESHPYRVEFLRFEPDSPMPDIVKSSPHAAFVVPSIAEAMEGCKTVIDPFDATDTIRVAFIQDGDALIELMEIAEG